MRCAQIAASGAVLLLVGCANDLRPLVSQLSAAPPVEREQATVDCKAKANLPFGYTVDKSSLSNVIEEPARGNAAVQSCLWNKGMHVNYEAAAVPDVTGSTPSQR
jgi:hypothetical protein